MRLGVSAALVLAALVLRWAFSRYGYAFFPAYRSFSKSVMGLFAYVTRPAPFALWDWAAASAVLAFVLGLVRVLRRRSSCLALLSWAALIASATYCVFVGGWALNHYAPPLADDLGLEVRRYSEEELVVAMQSYLRSAAQLAPRVPRDGNGSLVRQDFFELADLAGSSYIGLSSRYEVFEGSDAPVKALVLWGPAQLYSGHTGIFWAPTGEAGVPLDCAVCDMPFTMCHEVAHRLSLASEQEANFAAYLACEASGDVRFSYAAAYSAYCYCCNALYRVDPTMVAPAVQAVADDGLQEGVELVLRDRTDTHGHYAAYEGPFKKVGSAVNDRYLKGFGQSAGVQSYGLVVDYLIAWQLAG